MTKEAVELREKLEQCFDNFGHDVVNFGDHENARTTLSDKYIRYILQELQAEITKAMIKELEGVINYPGQTVDAWADVAHQCILDRIAQLKGQSDV